MEIWTAAVLSESGREYHATCVALTEDALFDVVTEQFDDEGEWTGNPKDWDSFAEYWSLRIVPNSHIVPTLLGDAYKALNQFRVNDHEDKPDPELCCEKCGEILCDLEHKDTFDVLVRIMMDHVCTMQQRPTMGIQTCLLEFDGFDDNGDRYFKCVVHEDREDLEGSHMVLGGEVHCEKATYEESE